MPYESVCSIGVEIHADLDGMHWRHYTDDV